MQDPYDLSRFLAAQAPVYAEVLSELRRGKKSSHWMWFVFPQIAGLGQSPMAVRYSISGKAEAEAYLAHSELGQRLIQCSQMLLDIEDRTAEEMFGEIDAMKLRSSMTLFAQVSDLPVFSNVLEKFFQANPDQATLVILKSEGSSF